VARRKLVEESEEKDGLKTGYGDATPVQMGLFQSGDDYVLRSLGLHRKKRKLICYGENKEQKRTPHKQEDHTQPDFCPASVTTRL